MAGIGLVHNNDNDSDAGNVADNDSLASYMSSTMTDNLTQPPYMADNLTQPDNDNDHIPTRDTGPARDNMYNSSRDSFGVDMDGKRADNKQPR